ncbi:hypothetical protein SDC9_194722 [bioreactor metagenome]|uniref:Uncharacterized protein n=1 Tax=bioreactor metagenome TaxID=1076179 RepID=A0A645I8I9_9ZZZZ
MIDRNQKLEDLLSDKIRLILIRINQTVQPQEEKRLTQELERLCEQYYLLRKTIKNSQEALSSSR